MISGETGSLIDPVLMVPDFVVGIGKERLLVRRSGTSRVAGGQPKRAQASEGAAPGSTSPP